MQTYSCNDCATRFRNERRTRIQLQRELWKEYVFKKQTVRELAHDRVLDKRTIRSLLDGYTPPKKVHTPRSVHLLVDALYFGERLEETSWCAVVFRDRERKEDLWWDFATRETTELYLKGRGVLTKLGYTILSVTGDGFSGIRSAFFGIPFQMCQVHMERLVIQGTTNHPQLEAGKVLLALVQTLSVSDSFTFITRVRLYHERYYGFLNEKSVNLVTGDTFFTHEPLRSAVNSLIKFLPLLFRYEEDGGIPKTTNSLEGHFRHVRDVVEVHCGLSRKQKERVLHTLFLASSIAPSNEKVLEIL